ncbi:unnamed protein product [Prunus armeniaca]|uniref:Methyltransferase type 11 domain-containing protein n=1 Tax=Prunus armeniaca TaxID=36596 RepID=A0A6J5TEW9_PRUAR|nr:unnamed protein product [Prunus armeniaca]
MTMGTTTTQAYGEPWYWDNRYANESGPFDWYQKYQSLAPLINLYVPRHSNQHHRILVVGCGNSAFSEGMADDGYDDVVSIDISSVVIQAMQDKYSDRPHLKYLQMDVRDMSAFQTDSFDAVVDKEKLACEDKSEPPIWELTNPIPLNDDGSSAEELLGNNPDVHYIYVCAKDNSLKPGLKRETSVD